jgi:mono/diheme cytochrome c family protein
MSTPLHRTIRLLVVFGFTALLPACAASEPEEELSEDLVPSVEGIPDSVIAALPPGTSIETLREGRDGFAPCLVCHGAEGEGTQLGPPFRSGAWVHSDGTIDGIANVIRAGVPRPRDYPVPMPEMGGGDFDDEELRALATYVYALSVGR